MLNHLTSCLSHRRVQRIVILSFLGLFDQVRRSRAQSLRASLLLDTNVGALDASIGASFARMPATAANLANLAPIASSLGHVCAARGHIDVSWDRT